MDSSSEKEDLIVETFSNGEIEKIPITKSIWTPEVTSILDFIVRRILRRDIDFPIFIEMILNRLVRLNGSQVGNIASKNGNQLKCIALGESIPGVLRSAPDSPKSIKGIFGYSLCKNRAIISNSVSSDPRITNEVPKDHPTIRTLLLIPVHKQWILSLANKEKYSVFDIQTIFPLLQTLRKVLRLAKKDKTTILERTSNEKEIQNKFLAAMSHDLRTPLNGILGVVTLLPDAGPLTTKQKEYINTVKECAFQMVTLVNNFLDFNKMASESLILKKEPFRIEESIKDALGIVRGNAVNKGLCLKFIIPPGIPIMLGDRARLTQILSNLLGNAVKFTDKGKVEVEVKLTKKDEPHSWLIDFSVKDTGIGIPEEEKERIFEFFHQSSKLNAFLSRSGTGFGLSLSRELVHIMGGQIWVESEIGRGSVFIFSIPFEEDFQSSEKIDSLLETRILVVDDRVEIRVQLSEVLFGWGCHPVLLSSAREALAYLSHDSNFDLGLIDICMPNMTGIELAQNLRLNYPHIPLIGLSSNDISGGEEYFDYYTYKPINPNQLFSISAKCLRKPPGLKKRKSKKKIKILIAEDNKFNSYILEELLENLGYNKKKIKIVTNGKDCVEEIEKAIYDAVLMDIVMPLMDGIEATRIIQTLPNPPMIIAVSAAVMNSDKAKCQEVGISAYLEKPLSKEKLETALLPLVSKKKNKRLRKRSQDEH